MKKIQLIPISSSIQLNEGLKEIYIGSFHSDERREWKELLEQIQHPDFIINQVFYNLEIIGMITTWDLPGFTFIEHFAIKESIRGKGIGSQVIRLITETKLHRVILEVEKPIDKSAKRRIAFYKRLGFSVCKNTYWQPPYSPDQSKVKMLLMSFPDQIQSEEFMAIKKHIYTKVYQLKESMDLEYN